jgi:DNA-binding NtrC family response regulator
MMADLEPELFEQAIRLAGGNKSEAAARWLGVIRLKLREKLAEFGSMSSGPHKEYRAALRWPVDGWKRRV